MKSRNYVMTRSIPKAATSPQMRDGEVPFIRSCAMDQTVSLGKTLQAILTVLLAIAVFAPIALHPGATFPWVPVWLGAATAFAALVGAFAVFWQTGALRTRFLLLFFVAIGVAAACAV